MENAESLIQSLSHAEADFAISTARMAADRVGLCLVSCESVTIRKPAKLRTFSCYQTPRVQRESSPSQSTC